MKFIHQIEPWLSGAERPMLDRYLKGGGWITEFKETEKLERKIAQFVGAKHAVMTTSGTAALMLSLMALGVKRGDKVIVPNITMVATANAVRFVGAEPIFVDVDETLCIDPRKLRATSGAKVLIHVSLNGRAGDIEGVKLFCKKHRIHFLEDSCQAFASKHRGKYLGTFGELGCFSLSPHKIITTGNGGVVVTNDTKLYEQVKRLKDFGRLQGGVDYHEYMGLNFKFTDLQAVFGLAQFKTIRERMRRKKGLFRAYKKGLRDVPEVEFVATDLSQTTPWFIDILVPGNMRDALIRHLKAHGVGTRPLYPPVTSQPIYRKGAPILPVSEAFSARGVWLPSSCISTEKEVRYICRLIKDFFS